MPYGSNSSRYHDFSLNGKPGDHPLTDVLNYGLPVFTPAIDSLIKEINAFGGWESSLAKQFLLDVQGALWQLGEGYRQMGEDERRTAHDTLLSNLNFMLRYELGRLKDKRAPG